MGAEVRLMNICTVFDSSAFYGLLSYNSPTSATLDRWVQVQKKSRHLKKNIITMYNIFISHSWA